jgi:GDP dissociation inhibitor
MLTLWSVSSASRARRFSTLTETIIMAGESAHDTPTRPRFWLLTLGLREAASVNLEYVSQDPCSFRPPLNPQWQDLTLCLQLFKKYAHLQTSEQPWTKYGRPSDWNIDLVPKLLMANGELTNILVSTDVTRYLEFRQIAGSYVQQGNGQKATVAKVPSDAGEALRSPLMGLFEKRRAKSFLEWVGAYNEEDPATHKGMIETSSLESPVLPVG